MLETPEKIRELQRKLYRKAKQERESIDSIFFMTRETSWVMLIDLSERTRGRLEWTG
jgi:hypothetical protein